MHYITSLLNKSSLFLRYASLLKSVSDAKKQKIVELLFRANIVLLNLQSILDNESFTLKLISDYKKQVTLSKDGRFVVATPMVFHMSSQIGATVTSLCVIQNLLCSILPYVHSFKNGLPSSFNQFVKKLDVYSDDKRLKTLIKNYWKSNGSKLRSMRDIDQHFESLIGQTYYEEVDGNSKIIILLPDNPEDKSPKKFRYNNKINAYDFIKESFNSVHSLYDEMAKIAKLEPIQHTLSIPLGHMGVLLPNEERTLCLLIDVLESKINTQVENTLDTLEIKQIISKEGGDNLQLRKLRTDREIDES